VALDFVCKLVFTHIEDSTLCPSDKHLFRVIRYEAGSTLDIFLVDRVELFVKDLERLVSQRHEDSLVLRSLDRYWICFQRCRRGFFEVLNLTLLGIVLWWLSNLSLCDQFVSGFLEFSSEFA
jgi:hypothetical protein